MIKRRFITPTGNILVIQTERGLLECLSVGDYGKENNIKADFLGLTEYPELPIVGKKIMPLAKKWVCTISTQYGCSMGCAFCDVPMVGKGKNASYYDMYSQVLALISLNPEITSCEHFNVHFARMGEPTFNMDVAHVARYLRTDLEHQGLNVHPVVSTMMPKHNNILEEFLFEWTCMKNSRVFNGDAGLQLSINSTDEGQRDIMFNGNAMTLKEIGAMMEKMPPPMGRKFTLNFALAHYPIDGNVLLEHFDPKKFILKLTPMHETAMAKDNNIKTSGNQYKHTPYVKIEEHLRKCGYDVLVFFASQEEDESRITCGNAVLCGTTPKYFTETTEEQ